jgi:hypothetical protein
LKEEKDRLCGYPSYQQKAAGRYSQYDERPEMMNISLPAQRASSSTGIWYAILKPPVNRRLNYRAGP